MNVFINAMLFNVVWIACVAGSARSLIWPAVLSVGLLAAFQLHPKNRHPNDLRLVWISLLMGIFVDSIWIQLGWMDFTEKRPFIGLAPAWIVLLWVGFALTINHSLKWLMAHSALPALVGGIAAPITYFAGIKIGAVIYTESVLLVSIGLGVAWAISLTILVEVGKKSKHGVALEPAK